jgi:hypothetical protein
MRAHRLALAFAGIVLLTAARLLADFSGAWDVTVDGPQGPVGSVLRLTQKGDSVSGSFDSEVGSGAVLGVVRGDTLDIGFGLNIDGQALTISGVATLVEKDKLAGKMVVTGMGEFPFSGTRQKGN